MRNYETKSHKGNIWFLEPAYKSLKKKHNTLMAIICAVSFIAFASAILVTFKTAPADLSALMDAFELNGVETYTSSKLPSFIVQ